MYKTIISLNKLLIFAKIKHYTLYKSAKEVSKNKSHKIAGIAYVIQIYFSSKLS